jgi:polyisoprenoid-binding protein YceI
MNTTIKQYLCAAALLLISSQLAAVEFKQVRLNESTVVFGYKQMGVPLDGSFSKFAAQLDFDPADLAKAQARIDIDIASIDTGLDEANEEVTGKPWFNTATYPTASFVSTGIKALGGERYQATGKLSIKGRTLDVTIPVTFKSSGERGVFAGTFGIKRLDYAIGEGIWSDVDTVANEIQIRFNIVVHAAKK